MKPSSFMAAITSSARDWAASGLRFGASRDGAWTRPASTAASESDTLRADLP
jgi:hypothetical protein